MKKVIVILIVIGFAVIFSNSSPKVIAAPSAAVNMEKVKTSWYFQCSQNWAHCTYCQCGAGKCIPWPAKCPTCGASGAWYSSACL